MSNRLVSAVIDAALGRVNDFGGTYPSGRGPMAVRIGMRQRWLYARAGQRNPERYGACAISALSSGLCDLNDIADPVPTPELIQRIEVNDPGESSYTAGTVISIVRPEDQSAAFAPRAMLRDGVLIQVGTDLADVTSIKVFYGKMPEPIPGTAAGLAMTLALAEPWDTLLEVDLCQWLLKKATKIEASVRGEALGLFAAEEKELLADYDAHVINYAPIVAAFLPPRQNARAVG